MIFVGLLFIGMGLFPLLLPETTWYLMHTKDSWLLPELVETEPSDTVLMIERIVGGIAIILGLFLAFS